MYLANRFSYSAPYVRSEVPLTDEQLYKKVPSIFAEEKHESRSDKYVYIPTINLLRGLRKEGFEVFFACQCRTRDIGRRSHTKHMLRLRHASQQVGEDRDTNEIILLNSHDGTSSYQMIAGRFRFVCQNGLIVGNSFGDIRTHHKGDIAGNIIEGAYTILENFEAVNASVDGFKSLTLNNDEQRLFAESALQLKYDEDEHSPIESSDLLRTRRREDADSTVWGTFNRVQENLLNGGLHGKTAKGKRTTTKEVVGIDNNVKLNRALWTLAEGMRKLKGNG